MTAPVYISNNFGALFLGQLKKGNRVENGLEKNDVREGNELVTEFFKSGIF